MEWVLKSMVRTQAEAPVNTEFIKIAKATGLSSVKGAEPKEVS